MKKVVAILLFVLTGFVMVSCNSSTAGDGGMSETEKKNLETARAVAKMFEAGDWSKSGDYIAADAVDHSGMTGDVKGLDAIKANFNQMGNMMTDFKNETIQEAANGDYVYQWMNQASTMKVDDPMMGKAGSRNTANSIEVSRFNKDNKIVEHWSFISWNDVMKMMPQPSMNMQAKPDTAKPK